MSNRIMVLRHWLRPFVLVAVVDCYKNYVEKSYFCATERNYFEMASISNRTQYVNRHEKLEELLF